MRLIDADALKEKIEIEVDNNVGSYCDGLYCAEELIDEAPTVDPDMAQVLAYESGKASAERQQGKWNTHQVACILAELFGDTCACNYCGIDEWLPKVCDFANKECPDVVGVACWEQFLKHRPKMKGGEE